MQGENYHPVTPREVAAIVGEGGLWTRADIARALNRAKTTWVIENIETAVKLGYIERLWGAAGPRGAWVYCTHDQAQHLPGF